MPRVFLIKKIQSEVDLPSSNMPENKENTWHGIQPFAAQNEVNKNEICTQTKSALDRAYGSCVTDRFPASGELLKKIDPHKKTNSLASRGSVQISSTQGDAITILLCST